MANQTKSNFNNYNSLNTYNKGLGIPALTRQSNGQFYQMVPTFKGFDYVNPNYNSLTVGQAIANNYVDIGDAYIGDKKGASDVMYTKRLCPKEL